MTALDPSLIRGFDLFSALDDDQLRAVLEDARPRRVGKGAALFEQGSDAEEFFVLLDGRLKVVQVTSQGEQVLVRFALPGEVCGIAIAFKRPDYPASAIAVVDSLALAWPSESWDGLCARAPALALNTLRTVGQRLQDAHSRIREISTEQAERRVAHALLRLLGQSGQKTADGIVIAFPLTRQDMADMTGLTLYTVSRIMSAWDTQGLVQGGRQRILVRDPHRLALIAEGDGQDVGNGRVNVPDRAVEGAEKDRDIDSVNPADVFDCVEAANWAAHALHPKLKEDPDGLWPITHDIVHGVLLFDCVHRPVAVSRFRLFAYQAVPGRSLRHVKCARCGNLPIIAAAQRRRSH